MFHLYLVAYIHPLATLFIFLYPAADRNKVHGTPLPFAFFRLKILCNYPFFKKKSFYNPAQIISSNFDFCLFTQFHFSHQPSNLSDNNKKLALITRSNYGMSCYKKMLGFQFALLKLHFIDPLLKILY